jgi:uncharacterized protein (UPF0276 family)
MTVAPRTPPIAAPLRCESASARDASLVGPTAGLGLKPQHYSEAVDCAAECLWFEVHPENYMVAGGPRLRWLEAIRTRHSLSLHGVGLSLAADADPDAAHLARLRALVQRFEPFVVSEHLAWSTWRGVYRPDLLPIPRTNAALRRVAANLHQTQEALERRVLVENPSHYLRIDGHDYGEIAFLTELSRRTGCGLLLDVNNVWVSANNLHFDADAYIDSFPGNLVGEIHLAGHSADPAHGAALLIDSHDTPVDAAVWRLYERLIARIGPRPTLIERDDNVPAFAQLLDERSRAHALLQVRAVAP